MFSGFNQETIDFMWGIRLNNNKTWFEANKDAYKRHLQEPMKTLGKDVFERIVAEYADRGFIHKVSRIHRDARRVRDGQPYKDGLWFSIEKPADDWEFVPVFWFDLHPEEWGYGMGYYHAKPLTMAKLRARIDKNPAAFEKLIAPLEKQGEFVLEGEEYKRQKQAPTPKTAAWYNKKNLSLVHRQNNGDELFTADLASRLAAGYKALMPFYDYFATLDNDPDPNN
ncbi:MAG: DUF2461 domain-containing protein [Defluviitaleaceae bacterium]|nr:DUF2461 domain-containing protein [Defluviitaleaceae bacterium]